MKIDTFVERIRKKPVNKINSYDTAILLLLDIRDLLQQLADEKKIEKSNDTWQKRIFK